MSDLADVFRGAFPKAIDFVETDYSENKAAYDAAAQQAGYRLAGIRLGFAVFTTKPKKEVALVRKP